MVLGVIDSKMRATPLKGCSTAQMDTSPIVSLKDKSVAENPRWRYFSAVPGLEKGFTLPFGRSKPAASSPAIHVRTVPGEEFFHTCLSGPCDIRHITPRPVRDFAV